MQRNSTPRYILFLKIIFLPQKCTLGKGSVIASYSADLQRRKGGSDRILRKKYHLKFRKLKTQNYCLLTFTLVFISAPSSIDT